MIRAATVAGLLAAACAAPAGAPKVEVTYDVLIRGGTVYDGSGAPGRVQDVAIRGDRIAAIGRLDATARKIVDARGLAVAPGFINMLSWSTESLLVDGDSQSEIRQGVTLEVMGEGSSMGPLTPAMKQRMRAAQGDLRYDITWTTLAGYLAELERRGVSPNVASFVGAATVRANVLGLDDVQPTPAQLDAMRDIVRREMEAGALGIGSALIYAPGSYAKTEELIELCKVAARHGGKYASHIRGEGANLLQSLDELFRISREAGIPAHIHHIKSTSTPSRMERALERVERARASGLDVTANLYLYAASSTGLSSRLPAWAHDGGPDALYRRLDDPVQRARMGAEMRRREGPLPRTLLLRFRSEALRPLTGRTLAEVARERGVDEVEAALDLIREDRSRVSVAFFSMREADIAAALARPWVAIGSDGASMATTPVFMRDSTHPRAYGNFARLLGKYVREDRVISLPEAIRRLSGLPASILGLSDRGLVREGMHADLALFDPATIADTATYERPHSYAVGMRHVFVNGVQVLAHGEHTGARPGRAVWGPGRPGVP
ncbi:MAG TPA: D-aminoacylase [Usitatibacter sp.]|nr:D-aminoacylase [Usitatibacter sp.]